MWQHFLLPGFSKTICVCIFICLVFLMLWWLLHICSWMTRRLICVCTSTTKLHLCFLLSVFSSGSSLFDMNKDRFVQTQQHLWPFVFLPLPVLLSVGLVHQALWLGHSCSPQCVFVCAPVCLYAQVLVGKSELYSKMYVAFEMVCLWVQWVKCSPLLNRASSGLVLSNNCQALPAATAAL